MLAFDDMLVFGITNRKLKSRRLSLQHSINSCHVYLLIQTSTIANNRRNVFGPQGLEVYNPESLLNHESGSETRRGPNGAAVRLHNVVVVSGAVVVE